jgi:hypothetical protein
MRCHGDLLRRVSRFPKTLAIFAAVFWLVSLLSERPASATVYNWTLTETQSFGVQTLFAIANVDPSRAPKHSGWGGWVNNGGQRGHIDW